MTPKTAKRLEEFFGAFTPASRPLLLLDYDGTLAGFRVDRFRARPWAGVRELLTDIQREGRTRMAVITGRPPEEIAPMLALDPPVEVWGLHGAERLRANGRRGRAKIPAEARRRLDEVRARLKRDALGGLYEDKPNAAVIHWRGHAPAKARQIEMRTRALFEPLANLEGLSLLKFEAGLELRGGRDKGGAVRELLREHAANTPCTYLGDDVTDEEAFRAINQAKGPHLSVLVRRARRSTAADIWLCPPDELRWFLRMWLDALNMTKATGAPRQKRAADRGASV